MAQIFKLSTEINKVIRKLFSYSIPPVWNYCQGSLGGVCAREILHCASMRVGWKSEKFQGTT